MKKIVIVINILLCFTLSYAQLFNHSEMGQRVHQTQNEQVYEYFLHGVASGDPTQSNIILWSRISNESAETLEVEYTLSKDAAMENVIHQGTIETSAEKDYTLKIDVGDLEAGTTYFYQFTYKGEASPIGRTRTAAANDEHLRFGVVSCSDYQAGYFNVYRLLSTRQDLDAIIHLGDYIYEYGKRTNSWDSLLMRGYEPLHEILTLIDYRTRYSFYRLDEDLQAIHQQHPFIMVWDDHETANDAYTDGAQNHDSETEGSWEERKAVAKKAWFEWMPVREKEDQKIYRSLNYGNLMNLTMLDTRLEGRQPQIETANDSALLDGNRTLLGKEQLGWFKNELLNNTATWHIIGNQVIFGHVDVGSLSVIEAAATFFYDTWVGYPTERDTIINFIKDNELDNIVITTGDFHITFAVDITLNPYDSLLYNPLTGEGSVCVELATPSVSSSNIDEYAESVFNLPASSTVSAVNSVIPASNPHLKKLEVVSHGYALLDITTEKAQVDYFYTDTLYIPSINEIYAGSLVTGSGDNFWQEADQPSQPKAESPDLAPDGLTAINPNYNNIPVNLLGTYPNPADEFSIVNVHLSKAVEVDLQLVDLQGKIVQQISNEAMLPGFYTLKINTLSLPEGVYMIRAIVDNAVRTTQLVVQH